jgi:ABC-type antimicrobial peptide transport system permease subunit
VAASASERRGDRAVLSALGVSRSAQAWQLCLEELLLSGPAAVAGLVLGAAGVLLLAPSVTLTSGASAPVPPPVTEFAWARAVPLTVLVAVLPVLLAALIMVRRPDPAAQLRALESG